MHSEPTMGVDDQGVWTGEGSTRSRIDWPDIVATTALCIDCKTHLERLVELEHPSGHVLELYQTEPGFDEVMNALAPRFGFAKDWNDQLQELEPASTVRLDVR